jgi:hypothetical protein
LLGFGATFFGFTAAFAGFPLQQAILNDPPGAKK